MLPPGHLAAGFLTAEALLKIVHPDLPAVQITQLVWWGIFFGIAPDLDMFYFFLRNRSLKVDPEKGNHRKYPSHAPLLWLAAGLLVYFLARDEYLRMFGLLLWLCSWSHFFLDSIQYGIMWLWPFNKKFYSLFPVIHEAKVDRNMHEAASRSFFGYWTAYLKEYADGLRISLVCEALIVLISLLYYFK